MHGTPLLISLDLAENHARFLDRHRHDNITSRLGTRLCTVPCTVMALQGGICIRRLLLAVYDAGGVKFPVKHRVDDLPVLRRLGYLRALVGICGDCEQ